MRNRCRRGAGPWSLVAAVGFGISVVPLWCISQSARRRPSRRRPEGMNSIKTRPNGSVFRYRGARAARVRERGTGFPVAGIRPRCGRGPARTGRQRAGDASARMRRMCGTRAPGWRRAVRRVRQGGGRTGERHMRRASRQEAQGPPRGGAPAAGRKSLAVRHERQPGSWRGLANPPAFGRPRARTAFADTAARPGSTALPQRSVVNPAGCRRRLRRQLVLPGKALAAAGRFRQKKPVLAQEPVALPARKGGDRIRADLVAGCMCPSLFYRMAGPSAIAATGAPARIRRARTPRAAKRRILRRQARPPDLRPWAPGSRGKAGR